MCLILFSFRQLDHYPLVVVANRDEFYQRATQPAHWWEESDIFAGRDLEAMGTWLGVTRTGRFAAVTNVREPGVKLKAAKSRGDLTRDYLQSECRPRDYLQQLEQRASSYAGFNLLVGDPQGLWFYSNRQSGIREIQPGVYGISNGQFDEPWPKLASGKTVLTEQLQDEIDVEQLQNILFSNEVYPDHQLPETGVSIEWERLLSSRFIQSEHYGTRASTVVTFDRDHRIDFTEQNFAVGGLKIERINQRFSTGQTDGYSSG